MNLSDIKDYKILKMDNNYLNIYDSSINIDEIIKKCLCIDYKVVKYSSIDERII